MTLRERLSTRKRPSTVYRLRVDDSSAAERELTEAKAALQFAMMTSNDALAKKTRVRAEKAEKAFNACFEEIVLTALRPDDFEALVDAHSARPDTDDEAWNNETFPKACFLSCAPAEMTEVEWENFLSESCSEAEKTSMFNTSIAVNVRVPDPTVPKDLMGMRA